LTSRKRLLRTLLAAGIGGSVLASASAVLLLRGAATWRSVERLRAETELLAQLAEDPVAVADPQAFAARSARRLGLRVTLVAPDGAVLGDSARDRQHLATMENHLDRPEIREARLRGSGSAERRSDTTSARYHYAASRVAGSGAVGYVRLALPAAEAAAVPASYVVLVVGAVLALAVVMLRAAQVALLRQARPLERMAEAVDRAAASDDPALLASAQPFEVAERESEEAARLAAAVRRLQLALLERLEELGQERALLFSAVAGMREGLLLVDPDRRVRLANPALARILDLTIEPQGHLVEEVVRHPRVVEHIDAALDEGHEVQGEGIRLPGSERVFDLHVAPLGPPSRGGAHPVLALFVDITRLDRLEKVRREFVANVSHELRTPLTSMKAFVENLIDGGLADIESSRRFLEIVRRHTDHMGELIEDLTDLSLIETGSVLLELRRVDAAEVAHEVAEQLRPLAASRDVEVRIELRSPFHVTADRRRLGQMLTNLIHNAIKFNREGGRVVIDGRAGVENTSIVVEDTGIGIPSTALEKVFERFYQVNRDRSRAVGGTGLGLSIVKHLMRLHGGRVVLESELGRGSRFTLEFPGTDAERRVVPITLAR
jgi:two-component system phosphate regulon sensor histidine kinase PhoR